MGTLMRGVGLVLVFAAVGGLAVGLWQTGTAGVAKAESQRANSSLPSLFLPIVFQNYLIPFRDDFSNPNSGWAVKRNSPGTGIYLSGEYLIQVSTPQGEVLAGNSLNLPKVGDFEIQVSARSDTPNNAGYGLYFAHNGNGAHYTFTVDPWTGKYALFRWDFTLTPPMVTIIPYTPNPAILTGTQTNVLAATRSGTTISLFANGQPLKQVVDGTLGPGTVGIEATSFLVAPPAEAFFDNFAFLPIATQPIPLVARLNVPVGAALAQDGLSSDGALAGTEGIP